MQHYSSCLVYQCTLHTKQLSITLTNRPTLLLTASLRFPVMNVVQNNEETEDQHNHQKDDSYNRDNQEYNWKVHDCGCVGRRGCVCGRDEGR